MLPDFRVVAIAVISTFLFAVFAGFYTSSRLANERKPRAETLAAIEESPLNRIALNWPEPVQPPSKSLDLDFAVTAKVLRNPVRDVSDEPVSAPAPEAKVAASPPVAVPNRSLELPTPRADSPAVEAVRSEPAKIAPEEIAPERIEPQKVEPAKPEPGGSNRQIPHRLKSRRQSRHPRPRMQSLRSFRPRTRVIETVPGAATPAPIAAPVACSTGNAGAGRPDRQHRGSAARQFADRCAEERRPQRKRLRRKSRAGRIRWRRRLIRSLRARRRPPPKSL